MKLFQLKRQQILSVPVEQAWSFFATPRNLDAITPPDLQFTILSGLDQRTSVFPGQSLVYRIRIFPFFTRTWMTVITAVEPNRFFVDQQAVGPYRLWHHQHHFEEKDGATHMTDIVDYAIGYGPLDSIIQRLVVGPKLESIFDYRQTRLAELFPLRPS